MSTHTRRSILAGASALPIAAAVATVPLVAKGAIFPPTGETQADLLMKMMDIFAEARSRPHPDAELLALGREFEAAWENERRLVALAKTDAECDAAWAPTSAIVHRIVNMPATTMEGLRVKARAILWCGYEEDEAGPEMFGSNTDHRLAGTIIQDLLNITA